MQPPSSQTPDECGGGVVGGAPLVDPKQLPATKEPLFSSKSTRGPTTKSPEDGNSADFSVQKSRSPPDSSSTHGGSLQQLREELPRLPSRSEGPRPPGAAADQQPRLSDSGKKFCEGGTDMRFADVDHSADVDVPAGLYPNSSALLTGDNSPRSQSFGSSQMKPMMILNEKGGGKPFGGDGGAGAPFGKGSGGEMSSSWKEGGGKGGDGGGKGGDFPGGWTGDGAGTHQVDGGGYGKNPMGGGGKWGGGDGRNNSMGRGGGYGGGPKGGGHMGGTGGGPKGGWRGGNNQQNMGGQQQYNDGSSYGNNHYGGGGGGRGGYNNGGEANAPNAGPGNWNGGPNNRGNWNKNGGNFDQNWNSGGYNNTGGGYNNTALQ